jgi:hypothetical protein
MKTGNVYYADIYPYFKKVVNHHWDNPPQSNSNVWVWLQREYGIVHAFGSVNSQQIVVSFPDEKTHNWFVLRWT